MCNAVLILETKKSNEMWNEKERIKIVEKKKAHARKIDERKIKKNFI